MTAQAVPSRRAHDQTGLTELLATLARLGGQPSGGTGAAPRLDGGEIGDQHVAAGPTVRRPFPVVIRTQDLLR